MTVLILLLGLFILYDNRYHPAVYRLLSGIHQKQVVVTDTCTFDGGEAAKSTVMCGSELWYVTGTKLSTSQGWQTALHYGNPKLVTAGRYVLAFDYNGTDLSLYRGHRELFKLKTSQTIYSAKVNQNGFLTVVTKEPGYRGKASLYNKRGKELYTVYAGESYIMDTSVSDNGKMLAVCTFHTGGDRFSSAVSFYKTKDTQPFSVFSTEEGMLTTIKFASGNRLVAIGDTLAIGFDKKGEKSWEYPYGGATLQSYSVAGRSAVALSLRQHNQKIVILSANGKASSYETAEHGPFSSVTMNENTVLAFTGRELLFLNHKGYPILQHTLQREANRVWLCAGSLSGVVVYRADAEQFQVK